MRRFAGHFLMPDHFFDREWEEPRELGRGVEVIDFDLKTMRTLEASWLE